MNTINGETKVVGVVGDPVRHSLSPTLHNAAFAALGLNWVSVPFPVQQSRGDAIVAALRDLDLLGLSVTTPHKDVAATTADLRSDTVAALGAANCLVRLGNGLVGAENTDGAGFLAGLREDSGADVANSTVGLIGAGGAARAVARACAQAGARRVIVMNRSRDKAKLCAELALGVGEVVSAAELASADIVVNATTLGMATQAMPISPSVLHKGQTIVDIVYEPRETVWLKACRELGIEAHNGISMLIHQAAVAITHWTGQKAPIAAMRSALAR